MATWTEWLREWRQIAENLREGYYKQITMRHHDKDYDVLRVSLYDAELDGGLPFEQYRNRETGFRRQGMVHHCAGIFILQIAHILGSNECEPLLIADVDNSDAESNTIPSVWNGHCILRVWDVLGELVMTRRNKTGLRGGFAITFVGDCYLRRVKLLRLFENAKIDPLQRPFRYGRFTP
jgi:hypothetical protein